MVSNVYRDYTGRDPEAIRRALQSEDMARWQEYQTGVSRADRIAALVALCEEVLEEHASTLSIIFEEVGNPGPMLTEISEKLPEYRERLAKLKGE